MLDILQIQEDSMAWQQRDVSTTKLLVPPVEIPRRVPCNCFLKTYHGHGPGRALLYSSSLHVRLDETIGLFQ